MILLDTHVLIWMTEDSPRLGSTARQRITEHADALAVSAMTFWEMAMFLDKKRIALDQPFERWVASVLGSGITSIAIDAGIAMHAGSLRDGMHGDPADRMIVATARELGCMLLTADEKILAYAAGGHVKAIDARV